MNKKIRNIFSKYAIYVVLLLLCLIPEIFYIKKLGFYWDDWSQLFLHTKFGDGAFWEYYSYNRPLSAWVDILFFPVCGSSPVRWHILLLLLKWCLCIIFRKTLAILMPDNTRFNDSVVILFAICPLFSQTHISIAYTQHFTDYILFSISILLFLKIPGTKHSLTKILLLTISIICEILHLTITEYFSFLELIRIPLFYYVLKKQESERSFKQLVSQTTIYCILPLLVFVLFCFYRLNITSFFKNFHAETPDLLYLFQKSPLSGLLSFLRNLSVDFLYPFTGFISKIFDFNLQSILSKTEIISILGSLIISFFVGYFFSKQNSSAENISKSRVIFICFFAMILGFLPFITMNENFLNTDDFYHADRTFLASYPFVCMLYIVIVYILFPANKNKTIAVCLTVFLFCHEQIRVCIEAWYLTEKQNDFYHQLAVRIPGIENGTAIVDDTIIFTEQGNFATASALNILYPNKIQENGEVPIWVFSYPFRERKENGALHVQNRVYNFNQPPTNYIYVDYDNHFSNCVWVFQNDDIDNPHTSELQKTWIKESNLARIETDSKFEPNKEIFGEIPNNWCNYYQHAALLQQKEEWSSLSDLTDIVTEKGFTPSDNRSNSPFEWWPFIDGLLHTGRIGKAHELAREAVSVDKAYFNFYQKRLEQYNLNTLVE